MATEGMISPSNLDLVYATGSVEEAVAHIREKAIGPFGLRLVRRVRPQSFWLGEHAVSELNRQRAA